jgi:hypothetical protein
MMISVLVETFALEYILTRPAQLGEHIDYWFLKALNRVRLKWPQNGEAPRVPYASSSRSI